MDEAKIAEHFERERQESQQEYARLLTLSLPRHLWELVRDPWDRFWEPIKRPTRL